MWSVLIVSSFLNLKKNFFFFLHTFFSIELPFSYYFNSTSETNFVVWFKGVLYFSKTKPYYLAQIRRCISFKGVLTFQIELRLPDLPGKFLTAARPSPPLAPVTKLVHPWSRSPLSPFPLQGYLLHPTLAATSHTPYDLLPFLVKHCHP